ncbi:hemopexin repeat-containing protein [Litoribacillus peritrichatus]|uniref:Metalloenzyme domain-containing protein n=1 Tax=Litoribacillus peritrichatus TaxID=718191 RepID=A0ABP7MXS7_9GAMM
MFKWHRVTTVLGMSAMACFAQAENKVLLVGVDGLQYEKLQGVNTPNFDRLNITKAYTGGIKNYGSEQPTISGPGWATILTGVWMSKHGVDSNSAGLTNAEFPGLFKRIKDAKPDAYVASYAHWSPINTNFFADEVANIEEVASGIGDQQVVDRALDTITTTSAEFVFLHLDDIDHMGHSSCFGGAYDDAIEVVDRQLGSLLDQVEQLEQQTGDDWLVLVTTDHGRTPIVGCGHGNQTLEEKTIFIGSNEAMNAEFWQRIADVSNSDFEGIYGYPSQASIAPTVLTHLGIEIDKDWRLDGVPLKGALAPRKLMQDPSAVQDITWYSTENRNATIYRNGIQVDQVPALDQGWTDPDPLAAGIVDYVVETNGVPAAIRVNNFQIDAGLDKNSLKAYFFRNDAQYVRYDKLTDQSDSGYPKETNDSNWPGLNAYKDQITASFKKDAATSYFFLKNGQYINYDNVADKVRSGYPKDITSVTWPGLDSYKDQIEAALRWHNDKVYFFLSDGQYIRYDLDSDAVDSGYPKPINDDTWPGMRAYATDITAAVKWSDNLGYIFLSNQRYLRYDLAEDRVEEGYPRRIDDGTWPGLLKP